MKRREILKSGGGALAALLGGVAVASAAPTAASDREKVEAIEHYITCNAKARRLGKHASDIVMPIADRAAEVARERGTARGMNEDELKAYTHDAWCAAHDKAMRPYRAELDAAWDASYEARVAAARLFGQEDIF